MPNSKRPPGWWDKWFLGLACYISTASKDPSTQTGAVIVRPNKSVVGVGFNGFPQGAKDDPELYADRTYKYDHVVHCEINALLFANGSVNGCVLYTWPFISCIRCAVQMAQAGIFHFVAPSPSADALTRWAASFNATRKFLGECNLGLTEIGMAEDYVRRH